MKLKLRAILILWFCSLLFPPLAQSQYCSGTTTLTSPTGSFTDGSGSNNYTNNSNCQWLIQPAGVQSITLSFSSFDTEASFDFVSIYNGTTTADSLLGSFSGSAIPSSVTSTRGSMLVVFTTDASFTYTGWSASYTSTYPLSVPIANAATNILANGFTANWSSSALATGYQLDIATDAGFTSFVTGFNNKNVFNVTSYNITGLTANTYYYRVRAYYLSQTSINSNIRITALGTSCTSLNYHASKSFSIAGTYSDLGTNGIVITTTSTDDANSAAQNIGFTFNYNCQSFSQFILNTNGFIKLGSTPPSAAGFYFDGAQTAGGGIFNSTDPADINLISPFNHDLFAGTATPEYRIYTSGSAPNRICTIQYKNVREFTTNPVQQYDNMQFQIKLYETSNIIEFVYGDWTPSVNASAFKTSACGLKGSGIADNQLLTVSKGSVITWDLVTFQNANYLGTATFNFGNPPDRTKPDAGRTYRFVPTYNNDLTVGEIYSMGDASLYYSNPQSVSVNIINTGINSSANIPVTLTISGANSFTDTKTISSLTSGANALVTFSGFNATAVGSTSIVVSLPADDYTGDNTKTWTQNTNNYICNYSSTAAAYGSWGGGLNDSIWYVKYHVSGSAGITSVNSYIANNAASVGQTVFGIILNGSGAVLGKSGNYVIQAGDLGGWHSFTFSVPPAITDSYFYAGFGATTLSTAYYALGIQIEYPSRSNTYYQSAIDGTSLISTNPGYRFMIGVTLAPFAPVAGTASSNTPVCNGSPATLTLNGYAGTIHWQQSSDGATGWAYVVGGTGATTANYTSTNLTASTFYRAEVSQPGYSAVYSNVLSISVINAPTAPVTGTITQPTCAVQSGSVVLSGLPATGIWTVTASPGGITTSGTGVTSSITGIPGGTFTFTVTNSAGCTSAASGNVVIAIPPALPAAPAIGTITQTTCSVATGSVILNGLPVSGTWTLTKYPGGAITTGTGTSSTLTGLPAGTYTFTVADPSGCTSSLSGNVIINAQSVIPAATSANASSNIVQTSFTANWTSSASGTGYRLDIATDIGFTNSYDGYSNKDVGSVILYNVTGLNPNTTYYYRVRVYNSCGTSTNSSIITTTTLPNPPASPVANQATNPSQLSFTANWSSSGTATGYRLDVATDIGFTNFLINFNDKDVSNVTSYSVTGLSPNTTFYYRVRAYNTGGPSSNSNSVQVTSLPLSPDVPGISQPTSVVQTSFAANWNSVSTATGYRLDVATDIDFTSFLIGFNDSDVGNVNTLSVTGLTVKTTYYYRVRAYNSGGISGNSSIVTLTTLSNPPAAPTGLTASSCNSLMTLKWRKNNDPDFIRYRIYGGITSNPVTKIDSTSNGISDTLKVLSGLVKGQTYYFRLKAVNSDGPESAFSNSVSETVRMGVIPVIKAKWGEILICYNKGDSITSFQWFKGGSPIAGETKQYYDNKKESGVYKVETIDKNGCNNFSNTISTSGTKSLSAYPNPVSVSFSLKLNVESEGQAVVSLLNSEGTKVMEFQVENVTDELLKEVPVSNLKEGIYIVQVLLNHKDLYYTKIVVIK